MKSLFRLPASLLAIVIGAGLADAAIPTAGPHALWQHKTGNHTSPTGTPRLHHFSNNTSLASTGSGAEYASACISASESWSSASTAHDAKNVYYSTTTTIVGGPIYSLASYYENATTLCDGHPRLTSSPGSLLSTAFKTFPETTPISTSTYRETYYSSFFSAPLPTCSVAPSDCDGFWDAYSTSVSAWQASKTADGSSSSAQITPAPSPQTPPCSNQSVASSWQGFYSSFRGCGLCTIYGEGVELVYFPPPSSVSRNMCASTPAASLTHYGPGAVLEAYAGTQYGHNATIAPSGMQTAVIGQNTFTSGTAYISISKVYAEDRCSKTKGTPVYNAVLAMPSESVLSLRYSQDHFQVSPDCVDDSIILLINQS